MTALQTLTPYLPVIIVGLFVLLIGDVVVEAVRDSHRPSTPEDGCCSCGADVGDALVGGENYCWPCIDTWPDTAVAPVDELGLTVFPGHERSTQ
jgi:hypothetical protein